MKLKQRALLVRFGLISACVLLGLSTASAGDARLLNLDSPQRIAGKYIVVFKSESELRRIPTTGSDAPVIAPDVSPSSAASTRALAEALTANVGGKLTRVFGRKWKAFVIEGIDDDKVRDVLAKDPRIDYIEAAVSITEHGLQGSAGSPAPWHLDRIDQRNLPLSNTYTYGNSHGVTIFVLDSGARPSHTEFVNVVGSRVRVWDCTVSDLFGDCVGQGSGTLNLDCWGHGTAMASLAGGAKYGSAKAVRLMALIVRHSGNFGNSCTNSGDQFDLIAGIDHAEAFATSNQGGPAVINISLGLNSVSTSLEAAVTRALEAGIVVVVSAGNDNENACNYSPTRMPAVITVGASTSADEVWWASTPTGSRVGTCVDVFAPGTGIVSAGHTSDSATRGPENGTSAAAAIVSGIAALYLQTHADATPNEVHGAIVSGATQDALTTGLRENSPNRLVYSLLPAGDNPAPELPPFGEDSILSVILKYLFRN